MKQLMVKLMVVGLAILLTVTSCGDGGNDNKSTSGIAIAMVPDNAVELSASNIDSFYSITRGMHFDFGLFATSPSMGNSSCRTMTGADFNDSEVLTGTTTYEYTDCDNSSFGNTFAYGSTISGKLSHQFDFTKSPNYFRLHGQLVIRTTDYTTIIEDIDVIVHSSFSSTSKQLTFSYENFNGGIRFRTISPIESDGLLFKPITGVVEIAGANNTKAIIDIVTEEGSLYDAQGTETKLP